MTNNPTIDTDRPAVMRNYQLWDIFVSKQMDVVRQAYAESKEAGDSEAEALIAMATVRDGFENAN